MFRSGDVIPQRLTSIPLQIEDLLKEFSSVLNSIDPKELGTVVHELGTGLTGHGPDLRAILRALDTMATIGAERGQEIASLLANSADLQDAFNSNSAEFEKGIAALRTVLATAAAHTNHITKTLSASRSLDTDLISLLDDRRTQIDTIVSDVATVGRNTH